MTLHESCLPTFAGHQTFHPRFGWLKKAYDAVTENPSVFSEPEAPLTLGVGKNMVEAMKFWAQAFGVVERGHSVAKNQLTSTVFGDAFFAEGALDPYLEDEGSLWILHWRALSAPSILPVWWVAFNKFTNPEFTEDDLRIFVSSELEQAQFKTPALGSIKKDVDCLLRMYSSKKERGRQTWEELLDSPFRALRLIEPIATRAGAFRLKPLGTSNVPDDIAIFCCMDFLSRLNLSANTISLSRLILDENSPGKLLRLSEDQLVAIFERAGSQAQKDFQLASAAGAMMLTFSASPEAIAAKILRKRYSRKSASPVLKFHRFTGDASYLTKNEVLNSFEGRGVE